MIKNLLFDMGGVLLDFDPNKFVARANLDAADSAVLRREIFQSTEWVRLDLGSMSEEEAFASMCTRIPPRLQDAARRVFDGWDKPRLQLSGAPDIVRELDAKGYGLYLFSNAGRRHAEYWPDLPVARYFGDRLMVSAWHGVIKPDPAFYETGLKMFDLDRRECLFIDDNPINVEAAQRLGIDGIVYHGDAALLRQRLSEKGIEL